MEEIRKNAELFEARPDLTPETLNITIVNWIGFRIDEEVLSQKKWIHDFGVKKADLSDTEEKTGHIAPLTKGP